MIYVAHIVFLLDGVVLEEEAEGQRGKVTSRRSQSTREAEEGFSQVSRLESQVNSATPDSSAAERKPQNQCPVCFQCGMEGG